MVFGVAAVVGVAAACWTVWSHEPSEGELRAVEANGHGERATQAASRQEWASAIRYQRMAIEDSPRDVSAWQALGTYASASGDRELAISAWTRAASFQSAAAEAVNRPGEWYRLARLQALIGETDAAIESLRRAVDAGFSRYERAESDEALSAIRDDPRFIELVNVMRARPRPSAAGV